MQDKELEQDLKDAWTHWSLLDHNWSHFVTLTFNDVVTHDYALRKLRLYANNLSRQSQPRNDHERFGLAWVATIEKTLSGNQHVHLLLDETVEEAQAIRLWRQLSNSIINIKPYHIAHTGYLFKDPENIYLNEKYFSLK